MPAMEKKLKMAHFIEDSKTNHDKYFKHDKG